MAVEPADLAFVRCGARPYEEAQKAWAYQLAMKAYDRRVENYDLGPAGEVSQKLVEATRGRKRREQGDSYRYVQATRAHKNQNQADWWRYVEATRAHKNQNQADWWRYVEAMRARELRGQEDS